jgi:hypothetical protein
MSTAHDQVAAGRAAWQRLQEREFAMSALPRGADIFGAVGQVR